FAEILGVSVRTLQAWEQGKRYPSKAASVLLKIAKVEPQVLLRVAH
ncbi:transcriptional regulator, partial [Moraxella osloensis]